MSDVILRRYALPSIGHEGWAIIVVGSDGFFSAVSDWGNYAFRWSDPGCEFRKFLTLVEPDYFWSKITFGRDATVWDDEVVEKNIRERLDELVRDGTMTKSAADNAFEEIEGGVIDGDRALVDWIDEFNIPDAFDWYDGIVETKPEPQSWAFASKVLPRLQEALRSELALESNSTDGEAK